MPILACYDEDEGCYRLEIEAPFDPYPTADLVADVNQMNRMVEQQLAASPSRYMWFQDLFGKPRARSGRGTVSTRRGSAIPPGAATGTLIDTRPLCGPFLTGWQATSKQGANKVQIG